MATFQKGILGGFSGKIGTIVGFNWRGLDVMRSLPKRSSRTASEKQLMVQAKFSLVAHFLAPIKPLVAAYFGQPAEEKSRFNLAFSYHNREAIIGTYPDFEMEYTKVIITKGELVGIQQPVVTPQPNAELKFTWVNNSGEGEAKATDTLLVVVFNPTKELFSYKEQAATRDAEAFTLALPDTWSGDAVVSWATFIAADEKNVATSIPLGLVVLQ